MTSEQDIPDSLLHLFVDGELDPADTERVLRAMEKDEQIRTRVSQLQHLKALVKNQYPLEQTSTHSGPRRTAGAFPGFAAAALLLLLAGIVLGWAGHGMHAANTLLPLAAAPPETPQADSSRILLHIDDSDRSKLQALVSYTETLLRNNNRGDLKIEVVANAGGLDIFRKGNSPEKARLRKLTREYSNLELFACANALARLREKGVKVDLIPEVHTEATALDHIIERMREGWKYQKI